MIVLGLAQAKSRRVAHAPQELDAYPHVHEHAADVGVLVDRDLLGLGVAKVLDRSPLHTLLGVVQRVLVGRSPAAQALDSNSDARLVHEVEHDAHASPGGADDEALAGPVRAQGQRTRGRTVDAHLVLDADDERVVP